MLKKKLFAITALAIVWGALPVAPSQSADAPTKYFTLYSPAMKPFGYMPEKYAGSNPQTKVCAGGNISLPLSWRNAPDGTKSFAITMYDPVPRAGLGFVHWVAYDIPGDSKGLKEGDANKPTGFVGGKNGAGMTSWMGPCPPTADYTHPYIITLVATDIAPGTLKPGMTRDELGTALAGHALATTTFVARYHEPAAKSN